MEFSPSMHHSAAGGFPASLKGRNTWFIILNLLCCWHNCYVKRLILTDSGWFCLIPSGSDWFRLILSDSLDWFRLVSGYVKRLIPADSVWCPLVPTDSGWFQLIPAESSCSSSIGILWLILFLGIFDVLLWGKLEQQRFCWLDQSKEWWRNHNTDVKRFLDLEVH